MSDYDISEAFQRIEEELIASMRRNMAHHRALEQAEGLNYSQWQAEQLRALQEFRLRNEQLFSDYYSTINSQIEAGLADTYRFGRMRQERAILSALRTGAKLPHKPTAALQQAFFRMNDRKLNALIRSVTSDMKRAESAVLRFCDDQYRKAIFNAQVYLNSGAGTLEQSVDMATRDFLSQGINCIEYRNGARVPIDAYAKMALRTANTRAYLMGEASMRDEWGISTVIVNKRGVACPKCLNYVGRVFYDDVYGSAPIPKDGKYPLLSSAIAGGLYHPNCKDIHTTYFEGISTPPSPPTQEQRDEAERVYKLEQEQRYNERHIRKYKRLRDGSLDEDNRREYAGKLAGWEQRQKDFIAQHGDVLRRRQENEVTREIQVAEPPKLRKPLAKPAESGIINSNDSPHTFDSHNEDHPVGKPPISISDKQFGRKAGKHAHEFGYDESTEEGRAKLYDIIKDIYDNPDEIREGRWHHVDDMQFYIKGQDVVLTTKSGEFVTILKGGIDNAWVKNARIREV